MVNGKGAHVVDGESADDSLASLLDLVRSGTAVTRPAIGKLTGLGRHVVAQRVGHLVDSGLLDESVSGLSTGGRVPRQLRLASGAGCVLMAQLGATDMEVGVADLDGALLAERRETTDVALGPERVLDRVRQVFDEVLADVVPPVWGVGIGLPGPVEWASGWAVSPPIMPGWDRYPVRSYFADRYQVPVWVDNDVNVMALGELRRGLGRGVEQMIYVKVGTGIGAGLVSNGRMHRGAQGTAGDFGHVTVTNEPTAVLCRCGRRGCLETLAGGAAIARSGRLAAADGSSPYLAALLADGATIDVAAVVTGAAHGDGVCVELLAASAELVGDSLSLMVDIFNPSLILLGGRVTRSGESYVANVRRRVFGRSLPLATRDLTIALSPLGDEAGLRGAALMVIDELFSRRRLGSWISQGTPSGRPYLAGA